MVNVWREKGWWFTNVYTASSVDLVRVTDNSGAVVIVDTQGFATNKTVTNDHLWVVYGQLNAHTVAARACADRLATKYKILPPER